MEDVVFERLLAYVLDFLIVLVITSLLTFWMPTSATYNREIDKIKEISENILKENSDKQKNLELLEDSTYIVRKETIAQSAIGIVVMLAYYVSFAYYNGGQTFGKKITKIKIVNLEGNNPKLYEYLIRAGIINNIFFSIIIFIVLLILPQNQFMKFSEVLNYINTLVFLTALFLILIKKDKRGIHDLLAKTKVIKSPKST